MIFERKERLVYVFIDIAIYILLLNFHNLAQIRWALGNSKHKKVNETTGISYYCGRYVNIILRSVVTEDSRKGMLHNQD